MQDKDNTTQPSTAAVANNAVSQAAQGDFIKKIVDKIKSSENILVALSREPSVDEIAAAIGLTMFLDGLQKHTTAVYSGRTPDSLTFLQPAETFETNTDSLQDFIISLDKNKADHLRYKLEGDFVKIFITPYKSILTEDDLSFSHGDYNVDFVIALNVSAAGKLDPALHEHSRIMRDASIVNITAGDPGHFGEIEWSNPTASSLCEMITSLIFAIQESDEKPLEHDIATTLLAGIVAATDRFSNNRTNPDTLGVASKLMSMGADQQLITSNISGNDIMYNDNSSRPTSSASISTPSADQRSNLTIEHADEPSQPASSNPYTSPNPYAASVPFDPSQMQIPGTNSTANPSINPATMNAPSANTDQNPTPTAMIDNTNTVTPESVIVQPIIPGAAPTNNTPSVPATTPSTQPTPPSDPSQMQIPTPTSAPADTPSRSILTESPQTPATKQVGNPITPPPTTPKQPKNYAEMMEAALSETPSETQQPIATPAPTISNPTTTAPAPTSTTPASSPTKEPAKEPVMNPATSAPILPPPPAPSTDTGMMPPVLPPVQMPPEA